MKKIYTRFVPFDLAKELVGIGFDEATLSMYGPGGEFCFGGEESIPAPTYAEVLDWLLEKGLHTSVTLARNIKYHAILQDISHVNNILANYEGYTDLEEAFQNIIKKAILILAEEIKSKL